MEILHFCPKLDVFLRLIDYSDAFWGFHMVEQSREQVEEQVREQAGEQVLCLVGNNELYSKALAIGLQELKEEEEIYWNVKGQINKQTNK